MAIVSIILFVALREPGEHASARVWPGSKEIGMRLALGASRGRNRPSASDREPAPRNRWWTPPASSLRSGAAACYGTSSTASSGSCFSASHHSWPRPSPTTDTPPSLLRSQSLRAAVRPSARRKISHPNPIGSLKEEVSAAGGTRFRAAQSWPSWRRDHNVDGILSRPGRSASERALARGKGQSGFRHHSSLHGVDESRLEPSGRAGSRSKSSIVYGRRRKVRMWRASTGYPPVGTWSPPVIVDSPDKSIGETSVAKLSRTMCRRATSDDGHSPMQRGRTFTSTEEQEGRGVAIISEAAAEQLWPQEDPIRETPHARHELSW